MEADLQKLLQGLQALTEGDGPTLDAFVSRDAAELLHVDALPQPVAALSAPGEPAASNRQ